VAAGSITLSSDLLLTIVVPVAEYKYAAVQSSSTAADVAVNISCTFTLMLEKQRVALAASGNVLHMPT
jgi:hypothetical protein